MTDLLFTADERIMNITEGCDYLEISFNFSSCFLSVISFYSENRVFKQKKRPNTKKARHPADQKCCFTHLYPISF